MLKNLPEDISQRKIYWWRNLCKQLVGQKFKREKKKSFSIETKVNPDKRYTQQPIGHSLCHGWQIEMMNEDIFKLICFFYLWSLFACRCISILRLSTFQFCHRWKYYQRNEKFLFLFVLYFILWRNKLIKLLIGKFCRINFFVSWPSSFRFFFCLFFFFAQH